jgi:hypothetical protein
MHLGDYENHAAGRPRWPHLLLLRALLAGCPAAGCSGLRDHSSGWNEGKLAGARGGEGRGEWDTQAFAGDVLDLVRPAAMQGPAEHHAPAAAGRLPHGQRQQQRWGTIFDAGRSSASLLRRGDSPLTGAELARWWCELRTSLSVDPDPSNGGGGWERGHHDGRELLRRTAWWVAAPCTCVYEYVDTRQAPLDATSALASTISAITSRVAGACGLTSTPPNSCNLNYYPPGGGVGWHADDEMLFGGHGEPKLIVRSSSVL